MGRPRQSNNLPLRKLTAARAERWKRALSLHAVSLGTTIPLHVISEIERGVRVPTEADLKALAQFYGYTDPEALLREVVSAEQERQS